MGSIDSFCRYRHSKHRVSVPFLDLLADIVALEPPCQSDWDIEFTSSSSGTQGYKSVTVKGRKAFVYVVASMTSIHKSFICENHAFFMHVETISEGQTRFPDPSISLRHRNQFLSSGLSSLSRSHLLAILVVSHTRRGSPVTATYAGSDTREGSIVSDSRSMITKGKGGSMSEVQPRLFSGAYAALKTSA